MICVASGTIGTMSKLSTREIRVLEKTEDAGDDDDDVRWRRKSGLRKFPNISSVNQVEYLILYRKTAVLQMRKIGSANNESCGCKAE